MKIRPAFRQDIPLLLRIEKKSGFPVPNYSFTRRYFTRALKNKKIFILEDPKPIGFAIFRNYKDGCEIDAIIILKLQHSKGYGTKLLKFLEKETIKMKKKKLYSYCWNKNFPAICFYTKHNFYIIDVKKKRYTGKEIALLLCKDL